MNAPQEREERVERSVNWLRTKTRAHTVEYKGENAGLGARWRESTSKVGWGRRAGNLEAKM